MARHRDTQVRLRRRRRLVGVAAATALLAGGGGAVMALGAEDTRPVAHTPVATTPASTTTTTTATATATTTQPSRRATTAPKRTARPSKAAPRSKPTTSTTTAAARKATRTTTPSKTAPPKPRATAPAPRKTTTPVRTTTTTVKPPPVPVTGGVADQVLALVNNERAKAGCRSVKANSALQRAAQGHSADMAAKDYFSHDSQDGRDFADRIRAAGYSGGAIAENIAAGQSTASSVMKGWMSSSGHRANILNCRYTALGVGYAKGGSYGHYWTQDFGG